MRYLVEHTARLRFETPVREHQCEFRVLPRDDTHQTLRSARLTTEPEAIASEYVDYFGNRVTHFEIVTPHSALTTHLRAEVETRLDNPFDFPLMSPVAERNWLRDSLQREPRLWDYVLHRSPLTPDLARLESEDLAWPSYDAQQQLMDLIVAARDWLTATFTHEPGVSQPRTADQVVKARTGNAKDLAHLLAAVVRRWGFPARYVTGYREIDEDENADSAVGAWTEVLIPGAGWRGFDPTAGLVVNATYVAVAVGRDANDVPVLRSSFRGGDDASPEISLRLQRQEGAQQQ